MKYNRKLFEIITNISTEITSSISDTNELLLKSQSSLHGIFYPNGIKLILSKIAIVGYISPKIFYNFYDVFPLLIAEAGLIRGIRYAGKRENLTANGYLKIRKIDQGKMHHKFSPTFITWGLFEEYKGSIEEAVATYLLLHMLRLLILKIFRKTSTKTFKVSVAYPSPFTSMSTHILGKDIFLAPFSANALLDFEQSKYIKGELLGYHIEYILLRLNFVLYNPYGGPLIQLSTRFPAAIPLYIIEEDKILKEAYRKENKILLGIIGLLESNSLFLSDFRLQKRKVGGLGKIIIFGTIPLEIRLHALLTSGKIQEIEYSPSNKRKVKIPYFISTKKEDIQGILSRYQSLRYHVKKVMNAVIIENQTIQHQVLKQIVEKYG